MRNHEKLLLEAEFTALQAAWPSMPENFFQLLKVALQPLSVHAEQLALQDLTMRDSGHFYGMLRTHAGKISKNPEVGAPISLQPGRGRNGLNPSWSGLE